MQHIIRGLEHGFNIGYGGARTNQQSRNLPTASAHPDFVSDQLSESCRCGETAGPYPSPPFPVMRLSGIGVVPKKGNKLRLIHHLSSPRGDSVNDHIHRKFVNLQYITVDDAIQAIIKSGPGTYLSKVDIKSAFRICPVRRADWPLLGIAWKGEYFFDMVLPFGLSSSPAIFDSVATCLEWILRHKFSIPVLLHYLDDFLCVAGCSAHVARLQLEIILAALEYLGVPLASDKIVGPAQVLPFLGIILDTIAMEARLPDDKLASIRDGLHTLLSAPYTTVGDFESFLGKLSFASRVVVPGRKFMRRLWDTLGRFRQAKPFFRIKLPDECRQDLLWWQLLLQHWNGKSFFLNADMVDDSDISLFTDASGHGWGAFYGSQNRWMRASWSPEEVNSTIEFKELFALVAACRTWGHNWSRERIRVHCDNSAVVDCVRSGTSRAPPVMDLLRTLFMVCSLFNFTVSVVHVAGTSNPVADALSRFRMQEFRRLAPAARHVPDTLPPLPSNRI